MMDDVSFAAMIASEVQRWVPLRVNGKPVDRTCALLRDLASVERGAPNVQVVRITTSTDGLTTLDVEAGNDAGDELLTRLGAGLGVGPVRRIELERVTTDSANAGEIARTR